MTPLTQQGLITAALQRINVLGMGEELGSAKTERAQNVLRRLVGRWNLNGLVPPVRSRQTFPVVASDGQYTIGDATHTPDFTGDRQRFIESAAIILSGQTQEIGIDILTPQRYQAEPFKSQTGQPRALYIEPTVPTATLTLIPVPGAGLTLVLYGKPTIAVFADLTTQYYFDDGYEHFFVTDLAVHCCGAFQRRVDEDLRIERNDAVKAIENINVAPSELEADPLGIFIDGGTTFDGTTGE